MTSRTADPYLVLGVPRDADDQQVRDAYRRLAKRHHPDLHPDARAGDRMRRVNEAWDVLSDPSRRSRYDADHARQASAASSRWTWEPAGPSPSTPVRPRPVDARAGGPPWLGLLAVLAVAWFALGGFLGGFLLLPPLGFIAIVAVGALLSRFD